MNKPAVPPTKSEMVDYSVVIPCYNSGTSLVALVEALSREFEKVEAKVEIILVNDGSPNKETWSTIKTLAEESNNSVIGINLYQNVGQQSATICGLSYSKGNYVITLDDDLQHNPSQVTKLIDAKGHDIVIARLTNRKDSVFNRITSKVKSHFDHIVLGKPKDVRLSSYRLFSRDVVDRMLSIRTPNPFVPALMFYVTKDVINVDVEHEKKSRGKK